jgi:CRP-like cAMP-binding protein
MSERLELRGWPQKPMPTGTRRLPREELARREDALRRVPLFRDLPKRHLRSIARVTAVSSVRQGDVMVKEDTPGTVFFVIQEGRAKVVRRGRTIARLSRGEFFGEISLLDGGPRTASVVAEEPISCLTLAGHDFRQILAREPPLALAILKEVAGRLRDKGVSPVG